MIKEKFGSLFDWRGAAIFTLIFTIAAFVPPVTNYLFSIHSFIKQSIPLLWLFGIAWTTLILLINSERKQAE